MVNDRCYKKQNNPKLGYTYNTSLGKAKKERAMERKRKREDKCKKDYFKKSALTGWEWHSVEEM